MGESVTRTYGTRIAAVLAAWFAAVLTASALSLFRTSGHTASPPLIAAALAPLAVFGIWTAASRSFRQYAFSIDPRIATLVHAWRAAGFMFLVLASYGILPRTFAVPAGWGDMAIGVTAPLAAAYLATPKHRGLFALWHALGLLDLVMAISLGFYSTTLGDGVGMAAMTVLPLSLVPSFIVPLLAVFHIIAIGQAARWGSDTRGETVRRSVVVGA